MRRKNQVCSWTGYEIRARWLEKVSWSLQTGVTVVQMLSWLEWSTIFVSWCFFSFHSRVLNLWSTLDLISETVVWWTVYRSPRREKKECWQSLFLGLACPQKCDGTEIMWATSHGCVTLLTLSIEEKPCRNRYLDWKQRQHYAICWCLHVFVFPNEIRMNHWPEL